MEGIVQLIEDIKVSSFDIYSDYWVDITHIDDPHQFYIRLTKNRDIVEKIASFDTGLKPSIIKKNDIIIFNLKEGSEPPKYARGQICYIKNEGENLKYDIFALDYGNFIKDVSLEYIWQCESVLIGMPPLAIKCQLAYCAPREGTNWRDAIRAFKYYVGKDCAKMFVVEKTLNSLIVILYNNCPDDIATLLAVTDYTTYRDINNDANSIPCTFFAKSVNHNFKEFKPNPAVHVRVLSGDTLKAFYVADINNYKEYLDECVNITYYSRKEPEVEEEYVKKGKLMTVRNSRNEYDRGIIKEVQGNKALVHLMDLGKEEFVDIKNLRNMPVQCRDMPCVAIFCTTDNQAWDNGSKRFLYPGFEFLITIIEPGKPFQTPNIVNISPLDQNSECKPKKAN